MLIPQYILKNIKKNKPILNMLILTKIVVQYQKNYLKELDDDLNYYKELDLKTCINYATRALGRIGQNILINAD